MNELNGHDIEDLRLGMHGTISKTAVNQSHHAGGRYALCTMCIDVGQGIAVVLERV